MRTSTPSASAHTAAAPPLSAHGRALVLGGGGSTGNAWMIGVLAGLHRGGLDVTDADLLIGTSAGATTAAQISHAPAPELFEAALTPIPGARSGSNGAVVDHLARTARIIAGSRDPADMRRRMGAAALELDSGSDSARHERWRAVVAGRLPDSRWPDRDLRITAVEAADGAPVVFGSGSGVALADAVAASCASGAPHRIGERLYIDGGYRRNENADLARGSSRVLVLSPFGGRTRHPLPWRMQLDAQVDELRAGGSPVEIIGPEERASRLVGANAMDHSLRAGAARAGYDQGLRLADRLAAFWV